jgi:3-hydroxyacyl-CoA dehydrogenase/enoyl-CoA hydratase/3-hydroxybutyryl-CoA epimerase
MGSQIAAHFANAGCDVLLLDRVDPKQPDRNYLAKQAIEKLLNNRLQPLMSPHLAQKIQCGNLEDDLNKLKDIDWVIEVIIEDVELKHQLYEKISSHLSAECIISSNTSTIPLKDLIAPLNKNLKTRFIITHFFNPVRQLSLLEIVKNELMDNKVYQQIIEFANKNLGKDIVQCKDTPGFIANRLGCFWLEAALRLAIKYKIEPPLADLIMHKYFGVPKTGIFKLWDLIGIDLMPLITNSIINHLPANDLYSKIIKDNPTEIVDKLVKQQWLGNKTKQGFYKKEIIDEQKIEYYLDLNDVNYKILEQDYNNELKQYKTLNDLISHDNNIGKFGCELLTLVLNYAAQLFPKCCYNIHDIDVAMEEGYGWKCGPFKIIDSLATETLSGAENLYIKTELIGREIANLISEYKGKFYKDNTYWHNNQFVALNNKKLDLIEQLSAANLYKIDNNLAIEITNKMHVLDFEAFNNLNYAIELVNKEPAYQSLIIFSQDNNFCAGADLKALSDLIAKQNWQKIEELITLGQNTNLAIKYSSKPIISAVRGVALGGGCEMLLHSHAAVIHADAKLGLVETKIGLIPGWGGCKETILNNFYNLSEIYNNSNLVKIYKNIANATIFDSAYKFIDSMLIDPKKVNIVMNKHHILSEAIKLASSMQKASHTAEVIYYDPTQSQNLYSLLSKVKVESPIKEILISLFIGENNKRLTEKMLLDIEKKYFIELCKQPNIMEKINKVVPN